MKSVLCRDMRSVLKRLPQSSAYAGSDKVCHVCNACASPRALHDTEVSRCEHMFCGDASPLDACAVPTELTFQGAAESGGTLGLAQRSKAAGAEPNASLRQVRAVDHGLQGLLY